MKPEVRKTLLKIADDYFESLDLPGVDIEDITMTGSLANYNWSKYSDVDLHIIIDYRDMPMEYDLVGDYLLSKSDAWNDKHDIKVYGFDIEVYVQDNDAEHYSSGVYSVLKDEWDIKPEKKKISVKDKAVKDKANKVMDMIDRLYDLMQETEDYEKVTELADRVKKKIKKMRQCGLEEGGEWSVENMVFKVLRRNGMYGRLSDIKTVAYDKSVTLESIMESDDPLQWIKDIKTNNDIAQEIYDNLEWYKAECIQVYGDNICVDFVRPKWSTLTFSVRPSGGLLKPIIIRPSSFFRGFTEWVEKKWGIEKERTLDVYHKVKELMSKKIKKSITESDDPLQWMKDINPTPIDRDGDHLDRYDSEYSIVLDYFNEQRVQQEGEWRYSIDSLSGSIEWWSEDHEIIFWATPFWDGLEGLPIDYQNSDDYGHVTYIPLPDFEYKEDLISWLENEYPSMVYDEITKYIGPIPD
jgi:hypothetical protein